jgi:hypothetical protein
MSTRRVFLRATAAGAVVLGAAGAWRAVNQGTFGRVDDPAFEAWKQWPDAAAADDSLAVVQAAILAASPHNTQPWLFRVKPGIVDVFADATRHLGAFDPYRREMLLGLGCAVENLAIAATMRSLLADVELLPESGEKDHVARVKLTRTNRQVSPLAAAIAQRHTNRGPYRANQSLDAETFAALRGLADAPEARLVLFEADSPHGHQFSEGTIIATERIVADHQMYADSERWFRHEWDEIRSQRDGINLLHVGMSPAITELAMLAPAVSPESSGAAWVRMTRETHLAAPIFGVILVRDLYDARHSLIAGRLWQRVHLEATRRGVAMQPINQIMEWVDRDRQLGRSVELRETTARLAGEAGWHPTFGFRAGYAERPATPSVRRALEKSLVS